MAKMNDEMKEYLAHAGKSWKEAKETAKTMDDAPIGERTLKLGEASLVMSENGNPMVKRKHIIVDKEMKGRQVYDNIVFGSDFGKAQLAKWFEQCGIECEDAKEIPDVVAKISKDSYTAKALITQQKDSDFLKVKILEILDSEESDEEETEAEAEGDEEEIDLESMSRDELKTFMKAQSLDIMVKKAWSDDELRKAIAEAFSEKEETEEEEEEVEAEDEEGDEESDDMVTKAREFCTAQEIEFDDDSTLDDLKASIKEYEFPEGELDDEEKTLLKELGLDAQIKKAKAPVKAKVAAKKLVKRK